MSASAYLEALSEADAAAALMRCCGCRRWAEATIARRPWGDDDTLFRVADEVWATATREDVLEALGHHPEIGADVEKLRAKFASTASWSEGEQSAVGEASESTLQALAAGNVAYKEKYGHIFVVCATGKTASEMLALLQARLDNDPTVELAIAAEEQGKITRLRLEKLAAEPTESV